jgi:hypothetical protein
MTRKAHFRDNFLVGGATAAALGVSGMGELGGVSNSATVGDALGSGQRRLIGNVLNELLRAAVNPERDKQYA